jgi:hypothetical protein
MIQGRRTGADFLDGVMRHDLIEDMKVSEIIGKIAQLPPVEQQEVIRFTRKLRKAGQLSPAKLGALAKQLTDGGGDRKATTLKRKIVNGFYGAQYDKGSPTPLGRAMIQDAQSRRSLSKRFKTVKAAMDYLDHLVVLETRATNSGKPFLSPAQGRAVKGTM